MWFLSFQCRCGVESVDESVDDLLEYRIYIFVVLFLLLDKLSEIANLMS